MTRQLYEEALADVKKVKEVAEDNARRTIIEAVTPRIRELIERELINEDSGIENFGGVGGSDDTGEVIDDVLSIPIGQDIPKANVDSLGSSSVDTVDTAEAMTSPDVEGKVTLDLDALGNDDPAGVPVEEPSFGGPVTVVDDNDDVEYEISMESLTALSPVITAVKANEARVFEIKMVKLAQAVARLVSIDDQIAETTRYNTQITKTISYVEDMYGYVQEAISDPAKKTVYENQLETHFQKLNKLQERKMSNKTKKQMNEADVTLKLTGMPDDLDLDAVGVDLVSGEDETGEEGGGDDMGDADGLDLGGDEGTEGAPPAEGMGEGFSFSDDTIVEIDENMLRKEIIRMRKLREEAIPSTKGSGQDAKSMDDFGGGKSEGEPTDQDVETGGAEPLGEADGDDDLEEVDQMDEADIDEMGFGTSSWGDKGHRGKEANQVDELDELDQLGNKRMGEDYGSAVADDHETPKQNMPHNESRRLAFEKRIQERAKARAASLKKEAISARAKKNSKKLAEVKKAYAFVAKRFNESVARTKKLQSESRSNSDSTRSAENKTVEHLRTKLAETNLFNAKLQYTNKLLQNEQLTTRQKAQVIKQLDEAKTLREVKLVYESLAKTLVRRTVNENRGHQVLGSSSRITRPASTQTSLNEGYEAERWAKLAGINK